MIKFEIKKAVVEDYKNNILIKDIVKKYPLGLNTVYRLTRDLPKQLKASDVIRDKRDAEIVRLYTQEAQTMEQIGDLFNVNKERIRQILNCHNITKHDGGASLRRAIANQSKDADKQAAKKKRCLRLYGCTPEERDNYGWHARSGTLTYKYKVFKHNCINRKIVFKLTLLEWIEIWMQSNHLAEMGTGKGRYYMTTIDKSQGYIYANTIVKLR